MKYISLLGIALLVAVAAVAQHPTCDGSRYKDEVFTNTVEHLAVEYGSNSTISGNDVLLEMDIFEPQGDTASLRPVIVFAHGGSFALGQRSDLHDLCDRFSKRGYVTATISYRLLDQVVLDSTSFINGVVMAIHDMMAANRFLWEDALGPNTYRIDTANFFVGGVSAGAIMASHVAYMDTLDVYPAFLQTIIDNNGGFQGNTSANTQYWPRIKGVLNYSGAILRDHWIDQGEAALYSAHDEGDLIVPFGYGASSETQPFFDVYTYGSGSMHDRAMSEGMVQQLRTYSGMGHVSYFFTTNEQAVVIQESADFIHDLICGSVGISSPTSNSAVQLFPNPAGGLVTLRSDAGLQQVSIFDLSGRLVASIPLNNAIQFPADVSELRRGTYVVQVTTSDNQQHWQRLSVN